MTLSSMVVSRDWQEVSVLECILGGLHMDVTIEREPQRALHRLHKSKIDALIVDCDLNGTTQFLREVQRGHRHASTVPLVILGGHPSRSTLDEMGVLFAFEKPISVEQAVHTLSAARSLILDDRLRYHRAGLKVPVAVSRTHSKPVQAHLINVSQGGMQIRTNASLETAKPLQVSFQLPGSKSEMKAQAEITWQDRAGNRGLRFVKIARREQQLLRLWLAQQFFAN
jgi:DNA-binding NarL/FixJ family response regulator